MGDMPDNKVVTIVVGAIALLFLVFGFVSMMDWSRPANVFCVVLGFAGLILVIRIVIYPDWSRRHRR